MRAAVEQGEGVDLKGGRGGGGEGGKGGRGEEAEEEEGKRSLKVESFIWDRAKGRGGTDGR